MNDDDDDDDGRAICWHPYLALGLGTLFIVLGIADLLLTRRPRLPLNPKPDWWAGADTGPAPFSVLIGILLVVAGTYTLRRHEK
jgi:ribose/xylose/arabinose/galactoside ABC-type transport system permease subunit